MIKLTYKQLNSAEFNQALQSLSRQTGFAGFQASYSMAKIARKFQEELKIARELFDKKADEFIEKDSKGDRMIAEKAHPSMPWKLIEGKENAYEEMLSDFLKTEVTLDASPLRAFQLGSVQLSPNHMLVLEPILDVASFEASPEPSAH